MKKVFIISFLICTILASCLNICYAKPTVTEEAIENSFKNLVKYFNNSESNSIIDTSLPLKIDKNNKKIEFSDNSGLISRISYDLDSLTFTNESTIDNTTTYDDWKAKQDELSSPHYIIYLLVSNIHGVPFEDSLKNLLTSVMKSALSNIVINKNNYTIIESDEEVTITDKNGNNIPVSDFSKHAVNIAKDYYSSEQKISDSATYNTFNLITKIKNSSDTACTIQSTLNINPNGDFSSIKSNNIVDFPDITQENADYVVNLKVGQVCNIKANKDSASYPILFTSVIDLEINDNNCTITAKEVGTSGFPLTFGTEEKTIFVTVEENKNNEKLDPITLNITIPDKDTNTEQNTNTNNNTNNNINNNTSNNSSNNSNTNQNTTPEVLPQNVLIIPPSKLNYNVGENLDLDGLKITAIYPNNNIVEIKKGYTVTGFNKYKEGYQTITVNYAGFSRSFNVRVGNPSKVVIEDTEKLPQTGDFFDLKDGLYLLIGVLAICLLCIVYKSVRSKKNK